jgi:hypothetical protein
MAARPSRQPRQPVLPAGLSVTDPPAGVTLRTADTAHQAEVLTTEAIDFVAHLHRSFNGRRHELLEAREDRQGEFDNEEVPDFLAKTKHIRDDDSWGVAPAPKDLDDRRVEITGPVEPKMMINALNSGARVFMADYEDALSPTWSNVVTGVLPTRPMRRPTRSTRPAWPPWSFGREGGTWTRRTSRSMAHPSRPACSTSG